MKIYTVFYYDLFWGWVSPQWSILEKLRHLSLSISDLTGPVWRGREWILKSDQGCRFRFHWLSHYRKKTGTHDFVTHLLSLSYLFIIGILPCLKHTSPMPFCKQASLHCTFWSEFGRHCRYEFFVHSSHCFALIISTQSILYSGYILWTSGVCLSSCWNVRVLSCSSLCPWLLKQFIAHGMEAATVCWLFAWDPF